MKQIDVKLKLFIVLCLTAIGPQAMAQTSTYTLTANGIGPVQLGKKAVELPESVPGLYDSKLSDVYIDEEMPDDEDMPEFATWYFYDEEGETLFTAIQDSLGYISEITISSPNFLTAEGLHVGSLPQQVETIKGAQKILPGPFEDYGRVSYQLNGITLWIDGFYIDDDHSEERVAQITIPAEDSTDENLYEKVNNVIADALPYYLTSSSLQEMESHLNEISNIPHVERAYSTGNTTFYIDIENAIPISFSFYPTETPLMIQNNFREILKNLVKLPDSLSRHQKINKYTIAYQMGNDERFSHCRDLLNVAEKLFQSCGLTNLYENEKIIEPTVEFFMNDIYKNNYIFLNTHGHYDDERGLHWLTTSTLASNITPEQLDAIQRKHNYNIDSYNTRTASSEETKQFEEILKDLLFKNVFEQYKNHFLNNSLGLGFNKEIHNNVTVPVCYVRISENLINSSEKSFPMYGAVIFNIACESLKGNDNLAKAFAQKDSRAYLGYDQPNSVGIKAGLEFFGRLFSGMSIEQAYETIDDDLKNENRKQWIAHLHLECHDWMKSRALYLPTLLSKEWQLKNMHFRIITEATIPLHWFSFNSNGLTENENLDKIPLKYGFEISKFKHQESEILGECRINSDIEEKDPRYKITNIERANYAITGIGYEKKIIETFFADEDSCFVRTFVYDGKNYNYGDTLRLSKFIRGRSFLGELPDLITKAYNKAVNCGLANNNIYPIDEIAREEYINVNKEISMKIENISNQYIGKTIPVKGSSSITEAVIDKIENSINSSATEFTLKLKPSSGLSNVTLANPLYFIFFDIDNKPLYKAMCTTSDGKLVFHLYRTGWRSPSRWNRFAKIVQVSKTEYSKVLWGTSSTW